MEETDRLRERLQKLTDQRGVQDDLRVKKQELEQERLKLQYLKKTSLREQWLLEDLSSHNALQQQKVASDQQRTRTLQKTIYRIEKEVEFLEREESRISTNESLILKTLSSAERCPHDCFKEAQENFVPGLLALEVKVCSNRWTGESQVVSTATVTPHDPHQQRGVKVHKDGRNCQMTFAAGRWISR
ncbi:palmdelphin-like isoform X2 [Gadus chalcogrammus]|uniref:palmdelphin-like isoform X2 n=1 Tax=Gadus chalcogrammus TaxID=1042646 RepID=UPI0024C4C651|nr:palmdelphin-like isoform X2 [Gadus chalcogrammus]